MVYASQIIPVPPQTTVEPGDSAVKRSSVENGFSNRLHDFYPVFGHRHGGLLGADVLGDDDALTGAGGAALQAHALRARGRLEPAHRVAGRQLRHLRTRP